MPGAKRKKPFIDKKNAVTFRLVHRSQKDPLVADERAPQHVLVEQVSKSSALNEDGRSTAQSVTHTNFEKRKEEQRKYGIMFDDDYDYLQHLKDIGESVLEPLPNFGGGTQFKLGNSSQEVKLTLPSSVFASDVEEKIGLLNRAAPIRGPQPDLDPDIVAALYSDYDDSGSELEDDFISKANQDSSTMQAVSDSDSENYDDNDGACEKLSASTCSEEDASFEESLHSFNNEETRSRFTNYSLTSSVMQRNEGLTLLDDRFEKIFEEYDEDQIGALDGDDTDGYLQSGDLLLENVMEHFKKEQMDGHLSDLREEDLEAKIPKLSDWSEDDDDECGDGSDENKDTLVRIVIEEPDEKWDCESILSTYSNIYNHPKLIQEPPKAKSIKISSKMGIPIGVLNSSGITASALKTLDAEENVTSTPSVKNLTPKRSKEETTEEKRNRKRIIKEQRRERRIEKKANSTAFKEEKKRQVKVMMNLKQNLAGIKLS